MGASSESVVLKGMPKAADWDGRDRTGWKGPAGGQVLRSQDWGKRGKRLMLRVGQGGESSPDAAEQGHTAVVRCR